MGIVINYPVINRLDFGVVDDKYVTLRNLRYDDITVPKGFVFDGVTVKAPFTFIFSNKNLRQGIKASSFHDWMCNHKDQYKRNYATRTLTQIWKQNGLGHIKAGIVYVCVELYQICKGWK